MSGTLFKTHNKPVLTYKLLRLTLYSVNERRFLDAHFLQGLTCNTPYTQPLARLTAHVCVEPTDTNRVQVQWVVLAEGMPAADVPTHLAQVSTNVQISAITTSLAM